MRSAKSPDRVLLASIAALIALLASAGIAGLWVLTAIPIGVLFGFFLQKGDLCGASAISEVILFRDRRKLWGLWVAVVISMIGFAALDLLGWVKLNPKPLVWANFAIGGAIFGAGTVLAGGCVSGCLYPAGVKVVVASAMPLRRLVGGVVEAERGIEHDLVDVTPVADPL